MKKLLSLGLILVMLLSIIPLGAVTVMADDGKTESLKWIDGKYYYLVNGEKTESIGEFNETYSIRFVSEKYGLHDMPIMYGLNFGHASPICVLPYGAQAEFDVDRLTFTILESGVI